MSIALPHEDTVFDAALELKDAAARRAYLDRACAGNERLRARVEKLLTLHESAEDFFTGCSPALAATETDLKFTKGPTASESKGEVLGSRIGPYKLLQQIGEGGCGAVFMAEQEKPVRRRVALKIIKLGMDTKSVIARFEAERQALAMMDHPNIARALDAGATETGRPYFVMELVHGVKITEYCDKNGLDTRRRLDLFIQVCRAIQHAHHKGVVHRDIKPSNVLVTSHDGTPAPKVIDFGIAKAIKEPLTDKTMFTMYGHFIGTPAYMSPEQAEMSGLDVDTRSDVYSLGVLLYELLTGRTPFDQKELMASGLDEMRRTLREQEPHRPSTKLGALGGEELTATALHRQVEPPKLISQMQGDLDWIVMRALEKDRRRRYETANGLAMDIERHLHNEPVLARPPSRVYQFQKLMRRNRGVFIAVGAVMAALVLGLAISTWLFLREREEKRQETILRVESEMRERATHAALLVSQGDLSDADKLSDEISVDQPSLEGAAALRALGEWHALNGRWREAEARYGRLLQIDQLDGWDVRALDLLASSAAAGQLNDVRSIERLRDVAMANFGSTVNPEAAQRALRAVLLTPATRAFLASLGRIETVASGASPMTARVQPVAPADWPLQLTDVDTGQPHAIAYRDGTATIEAGGANIWEREDHFIFAQTKVSGDFDYRLRVRSIQEKLDGFTRAGLMARDSLSNVGCREVMVAVNAENSYQELVRTTAGGETASLPPNPLPPSNGSNSWVRLQRLGNIFRGYYSDDGVDWTVLYAGTEGPFADPIYLGIAVCSHSSNATTVFEVSDFGATPVAPVSLTIPMALLEYRRGQYEEAAKWCRRCLTHPENNAALVATADVILAVASEALGRHDEARARLAQGLELVDQKFHAGLDVGAAGRGFWFEWVAARVLAREAENLIPMPVKEAPKADLRVNQRSG